MEAALQLFSQAYSLNGTSPQKAISEFKGVIVRNSFNSKICDCDDCDTMDCDCPSDCDD